MGLCACAVEPDGQSETLLDDIVIDDDVDSTDSNTTSTGDGESTTSDGDSTSESDSSTTSDSSTSDSSTSDSSSEDTTDGGTDEAGCHYLEDLGASNCDPLVQDCPPGYGCYKTGTFFDCLQTTDGFMEEGACTYWNECAAGYICAVSSATPPCGAAMGQGCCAKFCDLDCPDCDYPGTFCGASGAPVAGFEDVGYCQAR